VSLLATPRLRAAIWLTAAGLFAALAAGRPEPVAVVAPFALLALAGVQSRRLRPLTGSLRLERDRVRQGDRVDGELELQSDNASGRLEVRLALPPGLVVERDDLRALALRAGESVTLDLTLRGERWGAYSDARVRVRRYDRLRLVADEHEIELGRPLRVYAEEVALRAVARPHETEASVGDEVARSKGEGIELAELRPFVVGDDLRRINWRATARTGELVVNQFLPERNTTVVLLLDVLTDLQSMHGAPLDQCVQAASALAERYLARRDRVGLLALGSGLRWLPSGSGATQVHRIADTLLEVRTLVAAGDEARLLAVPVRAIPPRALVLVLSPLLEDAIVRTLLELRGRGFDLAVVEIPPLPYLEAEGEDAKLAVRLLRLERDLLRSRLRARGIAVVEWSKDSSLEETIRAMEEFRRRARVVYA
jgi:uncharacterized protein (DUF58 family)